MDFKKVNFLAVLVAASVGFMLGGIWYGPLFGQAWANALGKTVAELISPSPTMGFGFIAVLVMSAFLAWLIVQTNMTGFGRGTLMGLIVSMAFILTSKYMQISSDKVPWTIFFIHGGYDVVIFIIMGAILGAWQKRS